MSNELIPPLGEGFEPPRSNGEPVFDAPWHSRAFGMAVHLHQRGVFPWDAFKERLIETIGQGTKDEVDDPSVYYLQFVAAFDSLLVEHGILAASEIEQRTAEEREAALHVHDSEHQA